MATKWLTFVFSFGEADYDITATMSAQIVPTLDKSAPIEIENETIDWPITIDDLPYRPREVEEAFGKDFLDSLEAEILFQGEGERYAD